VEVEAVVLEAVAVPEALENHIQHLFQVVTLQVL
jgi:hypothetical protein